MMTIIIMTIIFSMCVSLIVGIPFVMTILFIVIICITVIVGIPFIMSIFIIVMIILIVMVIVVIIMVLFGSTQIPKLARSLGQAQKEFKSGLEEGMEDDAAKEA